MKAPRYKERTPAELRRALLWAQRKLHLCDWTLTLLVDDAVRRCVLLAPVHEDPAGCALRFSGLYGIIGVQRGLYKEEDKDPLFGLMHEVGHVVLAFDDTVDPEGRYNPLWERTCNRIALLLCELWQREEDE